MKELRETNKYKKHLKEMKKSARGRELLTKLEDIIGKLRIGERLESQYRDHQLSDSGSFVGQRECHLAGDLVLIYILEKERIILNQLGSHTEVYDQSRKRARVRK